VLEAGHITFGSLNNFCKVTPPVLDLWSRILLEAPDSRLILRCPAGQTQQRVLGFFTQRGIDPARLNLYSNWLGAGEYLRLHDRIDIYLDPFPHSGHTTSMDALWMGVPLITLAGTTAVGGGGKFLLANLGLDELIAHNPEEYVSKAVELARDLPRLKQLRATLRQRMERSPLMDAPTYARNIEAAYRQMWRAYFEGL
jgi:predicted O-linked N-acetylglucosamine transferase (SPINDLY family)